MHIGYNLTRHKSTSNVTHIDAMCRGLQSSVSDVRAMSHGVFQVLEYATSY